MLSFTNFSGSGIYENDSQESCGEAAVGVVVSAMGIVSSILSTLWTKL